MSVRMARQTDENIRFSSVNPQYLHANSTGHTWAFSAIAELIDNAYDPDVGAKQIWIDWTKIKDFACLTFTDNGAGMDFDKMHKMLSFGFSDKQALEGRAPVGLYGNGFKSGSMFLGKDSIVFSKNIYSMTVGLLSQTYLAAIQAQNVVVPIVTFRKNEENKFSAIPQHRGSLKAILEHSLFQTEEQLLRELEIIKGLTGTRIIIWNLRSATSGQIEFEFKEDIADIQIPYVDSTDEQKRPIRRPAWVAEFEFSLREYCSILYLKPWMQILIRGKKVKTQLVAKSLAHTVKDRYTPKFLKESISLTFGYRTKSEGPYGVLMYYQNRLIRPYVHLGCQLRANAKGVGVIGVIECNFLKPTHNKQEFADSEEYRKIKHNIGVKLEEYWEEIQHKRKENPSNTESTDMEGTSSHKKWVQCDDCLKWRKLAGGIDPESLPDVWVCSMNEDPKFRRCWGSKEPENSEEEQPHEKQYKQGTSSRKKWVQCDDCRKWRKLADDIDPESLPDVWVCSMNEDPKFRRCLVPEEPANSEEEQPHEKQYKLREKKKQKQQKKKGQQNSEDSESTPKTSATPSKRYDTRQRIGDAPTSLTSSSSPLSSSGDDPSADTMLSTYTVPENPSSRRIREKSLSPPPFFSSSDHPPSFDSVLSTYTVPKSSPSGSCWVDEEQEDSKGELPYEKKYEQVKRKLFTLKNKEGQRANMIGLQNNTSEAVATTASSALCLAMSSITITGNQNCMQVQTATLERDLYREQVETVNQERDQHSEQVKTVTQERDQYWEQMETITQEGDQYSDQVKTVTQERDQYREQVEQERDQYWEHMETVTQERNQHWEQVEAVTEERDQYREQMETVTQERDPYRAQMETVTQERDQYRNQVKTVTQERDQYRAQMETITQERDQYRNQVKTVTQERDQYREQLEQERDQYRAQMKTITQERDQYRAQMKTITQEREQ